MIKLILFLLYFTNSSYAEDSDLCKYFKYCGGSSRSGSQSLPSTSTAANLNPGNISSIKGFGIETIYQPRNNPSFDLVTGNGKIGALISPTLENSFFGNRAVEIDDVYLVRRTSRIQYKNKKLNLAIGAKLIDKKSFAVSLGVSGKRNPDIKKINMGYGITAKLGILNLGAYFYKDDVKIDLMNYIIPYTLGSYAIYYNNSTYQEKFLVTIFTAGTKIKNLSLDFGVIKTKYKFYTENTNITLY